MAEVQVERVCNILNDAGVNYLLTAEDGQFRVRPFSTAHIFEGKLYIQTEKVKSCSKQLLTKPRAEVWALYKGTGMRIAGELVEDDRVEVKKSMLDAYSNLRGMYDEKDGSTQMFYFKNAVAIFSSVTGASEIIEL